MKNNLTKYTTNTLRAALVAALCAAASSSFAADSGYGPAGALSEHVTYTYDVPWDAVHRYAPALKPYAAAQGCHEEHQTVPGHGGGKQTVNIVRCY